MVALYLSYAVMGYVRHAATARSTLDQAKEAKAASLAPAVAGGTAARAHIQLAREAREDVLLVGALQPRNIWS